MRPHCLNETTHICFKSIGQADSVGSLIEKERQAIDILFMLDDVIALYTIPLFLTCKIADVGFCLQDYKRKLVKHLHPLHFDTMSDCKVVIIVIHHYGGEA